MQFHFQPLPNGRFGIYEGNELLATIGCLEECQKIIEMLQQRLLEQRDMPDSFSLHSLHDIRHPYLVYVSSAKASYRVSE